MEIKQLHFICRDEGISLNRSKILSVRGLISKSYLALSLIRTPLVSQEFGVMRPPGVGGVFGIASGCFGTSKGSRVFRQVKTAYLIDGRQMTYELKVADSIFFSENSVLENFLILKQCIIQLHNFRKK